MMYGQTRAPQSADQPCGVTGCRAPDPGPLFPSDERDKTAECLGALRTSRIRIPPRGARHVAAGDSGRRTAEHRMPCGYGRDAARVWGSSWACGYFAVRCWKASTLGFWTTPRRISMACRIVSSVSQLSGPWSTTSR